MLKKSRRKIELSRLWILKWHVSSVITLEILLSKYASSEIFNCLKLQSHGLAASCLMLNNTMRIWCIPKQQISFAKLQRNFVQNQQTFLLRNYFCFCVSILELDFIFSWDEKTDLKADAIFHLAWNCNDLPRMNHVSHCRNHHHLNSWSLMNFVSPGFLDFIYKPAVCDEVLKVILLHVRIWVFIPDLPSSTFLLFQNSYKHVRTLL